MLGWILSDYIIDLIKYIAVFSLVFHMKIRKKPYVFVCDGLLVVMISIYLYQWEYVLEPFCVYVLVITACIFITFQNTYGFWRLAVMCLWSILVVSGIDSITFAMVLFRKNTVWSLISGVLTLLFIVLGVRFLARGRWRGLERISIKYYVLFSATTMINEVVLSIIYNVIQGETLPYYVVFILLGVSMLFTMLLILRMAVINNGYREREALSNTYFKSIQRQYEYLDKMNEETRKFRHDIRGHLFIVNKLIKEKEYRRLENYLTPMLEEAEFIKPRIIVGNPIQVESI